MYDNLGMRAGVSYKVPEKGGIEKVVGRKEINREKERRREEIDKEEGKRRMEEQVAIGRDKKKSEKIMGNAPGIYTRNEKG